MVVVETNYSPNTASTLSLIDKYRERASYSQTLSLLHFTASYYVDRKGTHKRRRDAVVRIFTKRKLSELTSDNNESYYRQSVLLNVPHDFPWVSEDVFKQYATWKKMNECHAISVITGLEMEHVDDEFEKEEDNMYVDAPDSFMLLARIGPNGIQNEVDLGLRSMDIEHEWTRSYSRYENPELLQCFLTRSRLDTEMESEAAIFQRVVPTIEQNAVLKTLNNQMSGQSRHRCVIVQGKAGTGKSTLIQAIVATLSNDNSLGPGSYKLLALTGAESVNINGQTIHSALRINGHFVELTGTSLTAFQEEFENIRYLLIDVFSMCGAQLMGKIERRCRQAMGNNEPFGGLCVYLFADIKQLPPVRDRTMYAKRTGGRYSNSLHDQGQLAYRHYFTKSQILQAAHRQIGIGADEDSFKIALDRLSFGKSTEIDWKLLMTRSTGVVPAREQRLFDDAIRIFTTKQKVLDYNLIRLRLLDHPVARVLAKHNCAAAARATWRPKPYIQAIDRCLCNSNTQSLDFSKVS